MIHPNTKVAFVSPAIGVGVIATQRIPKGTITWVRDSLDILLSPAEVARLHPLQQQVLEIYSYNEPDGRVAIDWDHTRYLNHSCNPTCLSGPYDFEVAVRDIEEGEQLTDDYACQLREHSFTCACGETNCRGLIGKGDFERLKDGWKAQVHEALRLAGGVPQPLRPMLDAASRSVIDGLSVAN